MHEIESEKDFLKFLSFSVYCRKGNDSFKLDEIISREDILLKYQSNLDNYIAHHFFFLEKDESREGYYKKTYRIPEICDRTIKELKTENILRSILDFLEKYPMILHTEFVRWLNTKHTTMLSYILDRYWHNFMIFSYEYKSWCLDNYGYFIHHVPTPEYEKIDFDYEDFVYEHAAFFAEYRKIYPISESILLYNLPYRLLNEGYDFKKIKNMLFDMVSEIVLDNIEIKNNIDLDKIDSLVKKTKQELDKKGYCLIKKTLNLNEYHIFNSMLGTVINLTNIEVKKDSMRKFNSHEAMPLHTDACDVDIISWFCQRQDKKDGKMLIQNLRHYEKYFDEKEIEILKTITIRYPIYKRFYTGAHPLLKNQSFYYAPWLENKDYTLEQEKVMKKFRMYLQSLEKIVIDIQEGDVFVLDNTTMIHGREKITENSERLLYRTHISK